MTEPLLSIDGHVHFYDCYNPCVFLNAAYENLSRHAKTAGNAAAAILLLTETRNENWFDSLRAAASDAGQPLYQCDDPWYCRATDEPDSIVLEEKSGRRLYVVAGKQVVTVEGLEVHALATVKSYADEEMTLLELVRDIRKGGGVAAIPWGTGKWLGRRGQLLKSLYDELVTQGALFSDSGIRPWPWLESSLFRSGAHVIAGTDPLPLDSEEQRVGSYGFSLRGEWNPDRPAGSLRALLSDSETETGRFGRQQGVLSFAASQAALRVRSRPGQVARVESVPGRETPDIETASDDYASRFAGKAGRYFLDIQQSTVERAMGGDRYDTIVELGGGHGQLVPTLEQPNTTLVEYGSDGSCHAMLVRRHPDSRALFVTGDMLALPFADRSADLVIHVRLISHIEDWPRLIAESCRVSRKAVIFDYPSTTSLNALTPLVFGLKKGIEKNTRTYISFSKRQLRKELAKHGFEITAHIPQFMIPMFVHRAMKGASVLQVLERLFAAVGLTSLLGSPVILRADRMAEKS